jgi:hypothetical protein
LASVLANAWECTSALPLYAGKCASNQSHERLGNISARDEKINRIYYSSEKLLSFKKLKSLSPCHLGIRTF